MGSRSLCLIKSLAAVVALFCISPAGAVAGTITFFDTVDTVTYTDDTGRASGSCVGESCSLTLLAPGAVSTGTVTISFIGGGAVWLEPGHPFNPPFIEISDTFCGAPFADPPTCHFINSGGLTTAVTIEFASDVDNHQPVIFQAPTVEDGTIQTAFTITWGGLATDTVKFQSDVVPVVPEPSSIVLLVTGVAVVGLLLFVPATRPTHSRSFLRSRRPRPL